MWCLTFKGIPYYAQYDIFATKLLYLGATRLVFNYKKYFVCDLCVQAVLWTYPDI